MPRKPPQRRITALPPATAYADASLDLLEVFHRIGASAPEPLRLAIEGASDMFGRPQASATLHQLPTAREPREPNYRVEAKAGDVGEIVLYGIIGESWFGGISANQFSRDLKALGNVKTINVRINSDGGDVFEGRTMYTLLAQHPARIVTHVDGLAASIASVIAMAGDEIRMADGSYMMIHRAWGVAIGNEDDMTRTADLLRSVSGSLAETYVARTGNDRAKVDAWMRDETWFTAAEAKEAGFADVVDEPVRAAAAVVHDLVSAKDGRVVPAASRFVNLPSALTPARLRAAAAMERLRAARPR